MVNPLKNATDGYLKRQTKAVLIIAVAGWLNYSAVPPTPPSGGGGGGQTYAHHRDNEKEQSEERLKKEREEKEMIVEFLKVATEIINNQ